MNTSYNYADFIGVNLNDDNEHKTCVDNKINQQAKARQPAENIARLNNECNKDQTVK